MPNPDLNKKDVKHKFRLDYRPEEMAEKIKSGTLQLHQVERGFAITELRQFTTERICFVLWLYGENFDDWKESGVKILEEFARLHGCSAIEAACRPGLEVALKDLGFKRSQIILRRELI